MKLSIIIPTFNEERTIEQLVRRILATPLPIDYEIVLVDDQSQDRTFAIERRLRETVGERPLTVLRRRTHQGKGRCIRHGLQHAAGDLVMVQDGDLEYDPRDIPTLLDPLLKGQADAVYGSRFLHCRWPRGMSWSHYLANRVLTWLTNRLYRLQLTDMETCYKVIRRDQLRSLRLRANRFEFEPEVTAQLAKRGLTIIERPIAYRGRTRAEGKKIRAGDFLLAVWTLLRYRF